MKRLFAMLTLVTILLTGCAVSNEVTDDQTANTQQVEQSADSTTPNSEEPKQERPNRTKREDELESIARFEINETFQKLLDEVNAKHEAVKMYDGDYEAYTVQYEEPGFDFSAYSTATFNSDNYLRKDTVLTTEQIKEDMEIYYKALRTNYGAYAYFGGDETFRAAIDAVITDCAAMEVVTYADLRDALVHHFSFVEDGHFSISNQSMGKHAVPFFFRNVDYLKTENGYETRDGKIVVSVDGFANWEELFKLSLTKEGELVYYPILLEAFPYLQLYFDEVQCSTPVLTVRYTDGSSDELTTTSYTMPKSTSETEPFTVREENGVPIIAANLIAYNYDGSNLVNAAAQRRDRDILTIDLRLNNGGDVVTVPKLAQTLAGREIWSNSLYLTNGVLDPFYKHYQSQSEDEFVSMDNIRIILTSKWAASGGEMFIDLCYNMENSLIVGENTRGWMRATIRSITLPNTTLKMTFGEMLALYPEDGYFEEYRGFYPDIWCPQAEAEEAVMNFIKKNTTVTYEQAEK